MRHCLQDSRPCLIQLSAQTTTLTQPLEELTQNDRPALSGLWCFFVVRHR
jgi:hypothetical protein